MGRVARGWICPGRSLRGRRRVVLLLVLLLLASAAQALDPGRAVTQYDVRCYGSPEGLPLDLISRLSEDREGHLWVAGVGGVRRFDGQRFTVPPQFAQLPVDAGEISLMFAVDTASPYFSGAGGVWRSTPGGLERILDQPAADLLIEGDRVLAALSANQGVIEIVDGQRRQVSPPEVRGATLRLQRDRHGALWVATTEGLHRHIDGAWRRFDEADGLPDDLIWAIQDDPEFGLLIGTRGGAARFDPAADRFVPVPGIDSLVIRDFLRDRHGTLWVATTGSGLRRWNGRSFEPYTTQEGLPANVVWRLHEDASGSLWMATDGLGLCRISDAPFTIHSLREGLANDFARSVLFDAGHGLWVGSNGGLDLLRRGAPIEHVALPGSMRERITMSLLREPEALWLGTYRGLLRMDPRTRAVERIDPEFREVVLALARDAEGTLWVGGYFGLGRLREGRIERVIVDPGQARTRVQVIRAVPDGLWLGGVPGWLFKFAGGRIVERVPIAGAARDLLLDRDGFVFIAADGLHRMRSDGSELVRVADGLGLPSAQLNALLEDAGGQLWIASDRGVVRVVLDDLRRYAAGNALAVQNFRRGDGLLSAKSNGPGQPQMVQTQDGRIAIATGIGVALADLRDLNEDRDVPRLRYSGMSINAGDEQPLAARIGPGVERLQIGFGALHLRAPEQLGFRYRLTPLESAFSTPSGARSAVYHRLAPGHYRFEAETSLGPGRSDVATWEFEVVARLHEQRAIQIGALALLLGAIGLTVYWRIRRLRAQADALDREVALRTAELERANHSLARAALTDPLTLIPNRRAFSEDLNRRLLELEQAPGDRVVLLLLDIDHFKRFNDSYGHPNGDRCLIAVAAVLAAIARSLDGGAARIGGEEFALWFVLRREQPMPDLDAQLLRPLRQCRIELHGIEGLAETGITASAGVASTDRLQRDAEASASDLLRRADAALYRAKQTGRDRLLFAT